MNRIFVLFGWMFLCYRILRVSRRYPARRQYVRADPGEYVRVHQADVRRGQMGRDQTSGHRRPAQFQCAPGVSREPDTTAGKKCYRSKYIYVYFITGIHVHTRNIVLQKINVHIEYKRRA